MATGFPHKYDFKKPHINFNNFQIIKCADINLDNAIKKFAVANQIDTQGLIKSEEQIQQETQQAQQQQTAQQMLADPRVAIEMGKQLANSNVNAGIDDEGNVQLNQGE